MNHTCYDKNADAHPIRLALVPFLRRHERGGADLFGTIAGERGFFCCVDIGKVLDNVRRGSRPHTYIDVLRLCTCGDYHAESRNCFKERQKKASSSLHPSHAGVAIQFGKLHDETMQDSMCSSIKFVETAIHDAFRRFEKAKKLAAP